MKRGIAVILAVLMTVSIPFAAFADSGISAEPAGGSKDVKTDMAAVPKDGLEKAIRLVKSKIDIPESYTQFNNDVSSSDGRTIWRLNWSSGSNYTGPSGGNISVSVDELYNIFSYSHYEYQRDYDYQRRLPKLSKAEAVEAARKFIYYIRPDIVDQISFDIDLSGCSIQYGGSYSIVFYRQYDGIPFYNNSAAIQIDGSSGKVDSFNLNWTYNAQFPGKEKAISVEAAQSAYRDKIGLGLKYKRTAGEDKDYTYLQYSPDSGKTNFGIDALTGGTISSDLAFRLQDSYLYKYGIRQVYTGSTADQVTLSGQELDAVKQMESLASVEDAEKFIRSVDEIGITDAYRLGSYYYTKNGSSEYYSLRLEFIKPLSKEDLGDSISDEKLKVLIAAGEYGSNVSVTLNARTLEIVSVNSYGRYEDTSKEAALSREELQKTAQSFVEKYKAEKAGQCQLSSSSLIYDEYMLKYGVARPDTGGNFTYKRVANGIIFEDNMLAITVNEYTGKITSYSESWDDIEFAPADSVIGIDSAYEIFFDRVGLKLVYFSTPYSGQKTADATADISLIYMPDIRKPACINARTGDVINSYNDKVFEEPGKAVFEDIENHPSRDIIMALSEIGLVYGEGSFRPDDPIAQKDFLQLIASMSSSYVQYGIGWELGQKELDGMYRAFINDGVLEENEKNPDETVSREEALKYMLRSIGYKKFAELKGLFYTNYTDKDQIDPQLLGYVAIAGALGIVDSKAAAFMPAKPLTRAEAAKMAYNYLRR